MKRWGVLVVGVVVAVVAAVVLWPDEETPPAASAPRKPAPLVAPLEIGSQPLWQGPTDVQDVEATEDAVLFQHGNSLLTLVDAKTGATRWTLGKLHDLGGVGKMQTFNGGPGERHLVADGVLIEYDYTADCQYPENPVPERGNCRSGPDDESGLVLVSAKDGSVVWRTPVITESPAADVPFESRPEQILRAANDEVALVTVTNGMVHPDYAGGAAWTVAIDVKTGKVRWNSANGAWPMYIAGDTMIGVISATLPGSGPASTVAGYDMATGEKRWERAPGVLQTATGDVAVVNGNGKLAVVKTTTGEEVGTFDNAESHCRSDGTVIACATPLDEHATHHRVTAYDIATGKTTTVAEDVVSLDDVWDDGRIELTERTGDEPYTVDRNGTVVDKKLDWPGSLVEYTGTRVIVSPDREEPVEVYEVVS